MSYDDTAGRDWRALMRDSERDFDTRFPTGLEDVDRSEVEE